MIISSQESNLWRRFKKFVPASSTLSIDTVPLANYRATKYLVEIFNVSENKFKALEIWACRTGPSNIVSSVFSRLGDSVLVQVNLNVSGTDAVLSIVNSETFDLNVVITRSKA